MDDLIKPLEREHEKLLAEQGELDSLSQAIESNEGGIDSLIQAAEELMRDLRTTASATDPGDR